MKRATWYLVGAVLIKKRYKALIAAPLIALAVWWALAGPHCLPPGPCWYW